MIPEKYSCDGQMTIFDFEPQESRCKMLDCFYEDKGICICSKSKYNGMAIPSKGCSHMDSCLPGGIPFDELRKKEQ